MTDIIPWEPTEIRLGAVSSLKTNQVRHVFAVQSQITTYDVDNPFMIGEYPTHAYSDVSQLECHLHAMNPVLVCLQELCTNNTEDDDNDIPARHTHISTKRHKKLTALSLAELWGIGLKRALAMIDATTQLGICSAILPISRRYRADRIYGLKQLRGKFATDTLYPEEKSRNGHRSAPSIYTQVWFWCMLSFR